MAAEHSTLVASVREGSFLLVFPFEIAFLHSSRFLKVYVHRLIIMADYLYKVSLALDHTWLPILSVFHHHCTRSIPKWFP